jgi:hypothetical protein
VEDLAHGAQALARWRELPSQRKDSGQYRQTANVVPQHLGGRLTQSFVWMGHNQLAASRIEHTHCASWIFVERTQNIATGDDAGQLRFSIRIMP